MNSDKKREKLDCYCSDTDCDMCPLKGVKWDNPIYSEGCLSFDRATKNEIDQAIRLFELAERNPMPKVKPPKSDYWSNICKMQKKQTEKGIKTYGQSLEDNASMTIFDRLEYLEEELIDGLMYIEHIKEKLYQFRDLLNEEAK